MSSQLELGLPVLLDCDFLPIAIKTTMFRITWVNGVGDEASATPNILGGMKMRTWKRPTVVVIAVGMEINSYACAEL
jgi:coenzyme PQQ precursor peptide PqqA